MVATEAITRRFQLIAGMLDERTRRLVAAAEALSIGRGGSTAVARATGISRRAIRQGIKELQGVADPGAGRVRREGGGRKKTVIKDPSLCDDLERLLLPDKQGNLELPLRWTDKSVRQLTEELKQMGHKTSHRMVAELLHELGYHLQVNRKPKNDRDHADWNAQVAHINQTAQTYFAVGDPVIAVEARKKEFVGGFRNGAREWSLQGTIEKVGENNFLISELGQVKPCDMYNLDHNHGSARIEGDHNIEAFVVESILHWWNAAWSITYAPSRRLLIITDGYGSNVFRTPLWNLEFQKLADETGLEITICHLPPGISKWHKIDYQFCAYVFQNWRGQPLNSYEVVIQLMSPTITSTGPKVQ